MGLLLAQVLVFGCLLAGLLTLLVVALAREFGSELDVTMQLGLLAWLLLLAVPLTVLKSGLLTLHNASGGVVAFNVLRLIESLAPLLLFVALFWMWKEAALEAALISWLAGISLVVLVGWMWLKRAQPLQLQWDRASQKELLKFSARSHPDLLFQQVILRSDYLFIGALLGSSALGHYAMASAAAELLLIVPEAVTTPLMKRLLQQDKGMDKVTPLALRLTATVMLCACITMLPGLLGLCYASILRLDLIGKNRPATVSLMMGVGALLNLGLNLLLIPSYGIVGAAAASSIAYLAVTLAMLVLYCRLSGVPFWHTLFILPGDLSPMWLMLHRRKAA
jgi:O-antigen/teichoic acid export membrane protein